MLNRLLMDTLRQIARGMAVQFGSNCEIVLHDLGSGNIENSIVLIENGHVSNRKLGDGPSRVVLEALSQDSSALEDRLAYLTRTKDGKVLKSSTMYIRDEDGSIAAILAVNYDITALLAIENAIGTLTQTAEADQASSENDPTSIPLNVNDLLDELIDQSIKLVGKPVAMMTKDDKIRAIRFLNDSGAFLVTKSGDRISGTFGISKYTLYSYIDAARK